MENTNSAVMTQAPVDVSAEVVVAASPDLEQSLDTPEVPTAGLLFEEENSVTSSETLNDNLDSEAFEPSEEDQIEKAREELDEIKEAEEIEPGKDDGYDEELATINETIRLLEIQRDSLKEQLGGGIAKLFANLLKYFFEESLTDQPESEGSETFDGPSQTWKEEAYSQLRKIEIKIAELKQIRDRLVAKNTL